MRPLTKPLHVLESGEAARFSSRPFWGAGSWREVRGANHSRARFRSSNFIAAEFMQYLNPVGFGPSLKT